MIGTVVSHYKIVAPIGSGGMGVVYRAEDVRLRRIVALKFLNEAGSADGVAEARLLREAQAASTLDHPNIATVYEIGEWNGRPFIAMAYYAGGTLRERIERGPMPLDEVVAIAEQMAAGLAVAHAAGVVHRDLKPANVIITPAGQVKILDFGLAKILSTSEGETEMRMTGSGSALGTVAYMAPEQALGEEVDARADIWALGIVMYEMLTGQLPFTGNTAAARLLSVVSQEAPSIGKVKPDVPAAIAGVVDAALTKDRMQRTITAGDIGAALHAYRTRGESSAATPAVQARRRIPLWVTVGVGVAAVAVVGAGAWVVKRNADVRWVAATAVPEIRRLINDRQAIEAYDLILEARRRAPADPDLATLLNEMTVSMPVTTDPSGAELAIADYDSGPDRWRVIGKTPLDVTLPNGILRVRLTKPGFVPEEDIQPAAWLRQNAKLSAEALSPPRMSRIRAPRGPSQMYLVPGADPTSIVLSDFWIDRFELTNREFKAFVDAGGYQRQEHWKQPFVKAGQPMPWEQAIALFRDSTGRPGPSTWQAGSYPDGQDEWPVTGVSWYEAQAYAAFAGKQLLTLPHWYLAAGYQAISQILPGANFRGQGPVRVGTTRAIHRFGVYDLAGNVKEWIANSAGGELKYIVGGAWDEPAYMFTEPDARPAFERAANFGIRAARYDAGDKSPIALGTPIVRPDRNFAAERPVPDQVFDAYRRFFAYDRTPVQAKVTSTADALDWRVETVTFPAAYGGETMTARVFLPKHSSPPFQTVVYLPGAGAFSIRSSQGEVDTPYLAFALRTGRAVVLPVVKGSYERRADEFPQGVSKEGSLWRDYGVAYYKDVARTIDYLETRPDIARDKIGYIGVSRGAALSPIVLALEPERFKTAVLLVPGLYLARPVPEADVLNFLPRVRQPVLMLNGRYDFIFLEQKSQLPFFQLLGTPANLKHRIAYDSGHNLPPAEMIKETLDWLDKTLGPVR